MLLGLGLLLLDYASAWSLKTETRLLGPITLHPGEVSFLGFDFPMPNQASSIGLVSFSADLVYGDMQTPVPLDRLYIHHWAMGFKTGKSNEGPCASELGTVLFGLGE